MSSKSSSIVDSFPVSHMKALLAGAVFHTNRTRVSGQRSVRLAPWSARWASTCDGEVLEKIVSTWDPKLAVLLLNSNPNLKKDHLRSLAALDNAQVRSALVVHPECPKTIVRDFVRYGGEMVRAAAAKRIDLPEDVQQALVSDRSPAVRASLANNPSVNESLRVVAGLR